MKKVKIVALVCIVVMALVVFFQNTDSVETKFLFASITMPRVLLLILTFIGGAVTGLIAATYLRLKRKAK